MSQCPFHARSTECSTAAAPATPLCSRLKTETQPLHDQAENHPHQIAVMSGTAGLSAYRRSLGQMATVHGVLEPALRTLAAHHPWFTPLVKDYHFRLPFVFDDMAFLDATAADFRPTASALAFADVIAASLAKNPAGVLGVFYVLEGSTNGGTIIAKNIKTGLGLADDRGTRFINPHGPLVRPRWSEWKTTLDSLTIPAESQELVVNAAGEAFRLMHGIMNDLATELPELATV